VLPKSEEDCSGSTPGSPSSVIGVAPMMVPDVKFPSVLHATSCFVTYNANSNETGDCPTHKLYKTPTKYID